MCGGGNGTLRNFHNQDIGIDWQTWFIPPKLSGRLKPSGESIIAVLALSSTGRPRKSTAKLGPCPGFALVNQALHVLRCSAVKIRLSGKDKDLHERFKAGHHRGSAEAPAFRS